ncbi:MAG: DNA repair protein RadC [Blastocatellia bacterium]
MQDKPDYLEHRKRLRERFLKAGAEALHDYELLELLLTYAIPRVNVKPAAKALMKRFGTLNGVLDAGQPELEKVAGVGATSAILIRLIKELFAAYLEERMEGKDVLSSPGAVVDFARMKLAGLPHEAFMVIYLNVKNRVIEHEVLHEGTVDRAVVYPRRIIEGALTHKAAGLILSHNHPSGDPEPSQEDKRLTRSVIEAARTIEIRVLDHIIVGKNGYFSFQENRLLA